MHVQALLWERHNTAQDGQRGRRTHHPSGSTFSATEAVPCTEATPASASGQPLPPLRQAAPQLHFRSPRVLKAHILGACRSRPLGSQGVQSKASDPEPVALQRIAELLGQLQGLAGLVRIGRPVLMRCCLGSAPAGSVGRGGMVARRRTRPRATSRVTP